MKFGRLVFLIGGIYGLLVVTPLYFAESLMSRKFPPAITHPEYYYGFVGAVVVWHLLFLVISRDPARYRPSMPWQCSRNSHSDFPWSCSTCRGV